MAVNAQLEARVKQQTEKIRDLNKQLKNRVPFDAEAAIDIEINDEDAKEAIEYRSIIKAGKVISAAELAEEDAQSTVGKNSERLGGPDEEADQQQDAREPSGTAEDALADEEAAQVDAEEKEAREAEEKKKEQHLQEARELVAKLMVLALASHDASTSGEKSAAGARTGIPRRPGSSAAMHMGLGKSASLSKASVRTPTKSSNARISSFGVASANSPVRSSTASPSSATKVAKDDTQGEKDQILDICRQLQNLL
ncbi:hypothetical protein EC988_002495 [Linderina pennispora]|nr:hypothetical protein EC988_002495 [Linderina pennispora]